jgi:hypothetical protein|uniref:hypothetical protein n=1 Tax=uncultured Sphingomonas sp. TaxID=158754 RepID=UPI0035CAC180
MKLTALLSAGLIAAAAMVPAAASAQQNRHDRVVVRTVHSERHNVGRHRARQVCKTVYRHHHRSRVCRTVRY